MDYKLTNDELAQLDMLMGIHQVRVEDMPLEAPVWSSKPLLRKREEALPLEHEAASESFLVAEMEGRCRLSSETRIREERRLWLRSKKRKKYKLRGRRHHRSKAATLRRRRREDWARNPLGALKASFRQHVDITPEEWQRLVQPVWQQHPTGVLRVKTSGGRSVNVYNMLLVDNEGRVVYNGPNQAILDVQDPLYSQRVMELGTK